MRVGELALNVIWHNESAGLGFLVRLPVTNKLYFHVFAAKLEMREWRSKALALY